MAVYVDDVVHQFGRMKMCHMWADTLDELLQMADRIGVCRCWIQGHPELSHPKYKKASWVHFDIALGKKKRALAAGAVLTDKYGPAEHVAMLEGNSKMLELIALTRARRNTKDATRLA
jgi:hypothetical protein